MEGDALKCAVVCFQRLIETSPWGDDQETLQQQLVKHQMFHSSIQRSDEMDRARDELHQNGDKASLNALDQEWDSLQKMSFSRSEWLQELQLIIEDISKEIMWVNYREEEELVFDWGERNIDLYIPKKQESYSQLMSALEGKERDLNRLKVKVDVALKNNHPASDKIEAYMDTLQTQWSWLLQITKCIHVHLKENAAYSQFFKEANETYGALQKEHETIRKKFTCDKDTSLDSLLELLKEKEKILENKRQVQHLVNMSKSIVRLKPRNPEEKSSSTVIVRALCDFKQDQKVICKDNEGILKDNSQRSKWQVTGPGGLDMLVPSVCLLVPPPNPISISMAKKNDQYYEAILSIWNQLYINIKSLISWQYCCMDIENINSLTVAMLSRMSSEEYRSLIKQLETHYAEFRVNSHGSQMIEEEDLMTIESQYNGAQNHYEQLVVQLPSYTQYGDILRIKDMILMEVEGMADADKAQFLRSDIGGITQRLGVLDSSLSAYLQRYNDTHKCSHITMQNTIQRLRALRNLLESVSHGEDIVKVHEARLTEKDTTSLSPGEVEDYIMYLKNMKVELDQKRDVFDSMEAEMEKANNWNSQVGDSSLRCDMTLATYSELVGQLTNRWRRIHTQIDCRWDLEFYVPQLQQYKKDSTSLDEWIDSTQKRQKALQSTKIEDLETVVLHISQQKALNSEIKEKRRTLDSVLTESGDCVSSIKDYESDLAAYGSGLETLLNIPIKRTILTSPSTELNQEAVEMQTRYMELFTLSGDYYTYLGAMQKNMEELKIRNTRIDLLEEELRLLKGSIESNTTKNRQLQDALARYQLELSNSKEQLLSVENGNEDESRKRRLAEDRYNKQKEEYEILLRRAEKNMTDKEREAEQLRQRLADESARVRELQLETSKVRAVCIAEMRSLKLSYESQIQASHADIELLAAQKSNQEEDLERIKLSLESECHIKQRLQEENDRLKNEFRFLKDKYDSQESKTRQHDSDKDRFEQEINDLKGEIQRLRKDSEVIISRKTMATDLKAVREPPNLIFDGVRKTVTAKQLHDCGVLDELTFNKLLEGKKRVPAVSVDKKVILKGTGPIAGVVIASQKGTFSLSGPLSKMSLTEAKKGNLIPLDCADLLLDAQAATGHMIDPRLNQKLTVEEACDQGLVDENDRQRLLAAEAAAVGYHDPGTGQPLSAFQAMKKGLIDKSTALRLLQAQECTGGILDPTLSVFLPKDIAIERDLINEDIYRALNQRPELYMDPETELGASYISLKRRCQKEPNTGLLLLPVSKKLDPSKLVFDGVRKPVTAKQLNDCGVLDKPMLDQLLKGEISVQDVSVDKKIILKGTGPIAGVIIASAKGTVSLSGPLSKMSLSEAKEKDLLPLDCADLLLDAQAATGHMIDPITNQKLTVEEACDQGLVAENDRQRLLAAEAAAVGYHDRGTGKPLSAFQAMKKGLIDNNTALRLIQAQESTGGFLDPILSVFVPKDIAYERDLINEQMDKALNQRPALYLDPTTEQGASYGSLKRRCKTEPNTGLLLL
uniref:Desmoplakin b n=1 Tax=Gadus morhua TaxID=8049 RepID=A0A8C5BP41_GADMO